MNWLARGMATSCLLLLLTVGATETTSSPFIVAPEKSTTTSRNEIKESYGEQLQSLANVGAELEFEIGRLMMRLATVKQMIVRQGAALLEDTKPFDTVSTPRLTKAVKSAREKIKKLQKLLPKVTAISGDLLEIMDFE